MGRIKIKDLPKDVEMTDKELRKVFGGGFTFNRNIGAISPLKIFKMNISGMERNEDDERIFNTTQIKY